MQKLNRTLHYPLANSLAALSVVALCTSCNAESLLSNGPEGRKKPTVESRTRDARGSNAKGSRDAKSTGEQLQSDAEGRPSVASSDDTDAAGNEPSSTTDSVDSISDGSEDNLAAASWGPVPDDAEVRTLIEAKDDGDAAGVIYVTINHLSTDGRGEALEPVRHALAKVLNSVSLNPKIVPLVPIDPGHSVFKVSLRDYTLENGWGFIESAPHASKNIQRGDFATIVKGDWLLYAMTRPEVYQRLMHIPSTVGILENTLQVDRSKAVYLNVTESNIVFKGRVLERVPIDIGGKAGGYYWRSFDFGLDASQAKGFSEPEALPAMAASIAPLVAGEYIFSLPNGLQGYMLSGFADQVRYDAQLFVATDKNRPQDGLSHCAGGVERCGYVINGESCITCHISGMKLPNKIVGTNRTTESQAYELLDQDTKRFMSAVKELGYTNYGVVEPLTYSLNRFKQRAGIEGSRTQAGEFEGALGGFTSVLDR